MNSESPNQFPVQPSNLSQEIHEAIDPTPSSQIMPAQLAHLSAPLTNQAMPLVAPEIGDPPKPSSADAEFINPTVAPALTSSSSNSAVMIRLWVTVLAIGAVALLVVSDWRSKSNPPSFHQPPNTSRFPRTY